MKARLQLNISHRLALISLSFVLPIAVMLYLIIAGINANIEFAALERTGNQYQRPLESLLRELPRHGLLSRIGSAGDAGREDRLRQAEAAIEKALGELESAEFRDGVRLQFTREGLAKRKREHFRAATLMSEWRELKAQLQTLKPEALIERHAHLVADVRAMITHVGDTSNLILDPDLDSFYLMDSTLVALPQAQDRLATVLQFGSGMIQEKTASPQDRLQLSVHSALLQQSDLDHIVASIQTALNEDQNFYGVSETLQQSVPPLLKAYSEAAGAFIALNQRLAGSEQVSVPADEYLSTGDRAIEASFKLWDEASRELDILLVKRTKDLQHSRMVNLTLCFLALLASGSLAWFMTRSINHTLRRIMGMLAGGASELASAVGHVASSSQTLACSAGEQAAALEETSAALEEMASMTKRSAESAQNAKDIGCQARAAAEKGATDMSGMVDAMDAIKAAGDNIAKIIKAIDEIAFQTNILALNAAVEAARAGEAGLGFAVVADEVRNLAQRSALAARETAEKIEDSIQKSEKGVELSQRVSQGLASILTKVRQVDDLAGEIATAAKEQSVGIDQVNTAVTQMDRITQSNAASAEEGASAAAELNAQTDTMKTAVHELAQMVGGTVESKAAATPHQTTSPAPRTHAPSRAIAPARRLGENKVHAESRHF